MPIVAQLPTGPACRTTSASCASRGEIAAEHRTVECGRRPRPPCRRRHHILCWRRGKVANRIDCIQRTAARLRHPADDATSRPPRARRSPRLRWRNSASYSSVARVRSFSSARIDDALRQGWIERPGRTVSTRMERIRRPGRSGRLNTSHNTPRRAWGDVGQREDQRNHRSSPGVAHPRSGIVDILVGIGRVHVPEWQLVGDDG